MNYKKQALEILKNLTLPEKVALQTGADMWHTFDLTKKGVPQIMMCDGPHGLRKVENQVGGVFETSLPSVSFPTASKLACSFDRELLREVGEALGQQCRSQDVSVLLAPGVNIKRNSLCGRNFEYFSEDPYLSGEIAAAFVKGVQSQGVGTSLKHFAANSQEFARFVYDSQIDNRALNEIYLSAFKKVVTEASPWTVMCAYNKLNGDYCSENKELLTGKLRTEWGFEGMTVSDWGAVNNRPKGIQAGLDLMMPGGDTEQVKAALADGTLTEEDIDACVLRIIELVLKSQERKGLELDLGKQHAFARRVSAECTVLAKNSCGILPFSRKIKLAVVGDFAQKPHIQGGGSSKVNPFSLTSICDALKEEGVSFTFRKGYDADSLFPNEALISEAVNAVKDAECVLLVVGLPDIIEYEGNDRQNFKLPESQLKLIDAVTSANANVVAVVQSGAPIGMEWQNSVKAVLLDYLSGQNGGAALVDIVFGQTNPSGRLAETWVANENDQPSQSEFGTDIALVKYKESIFVGYRFFDTAGVDVCFPFGYGLSYTDFNYKKVALSTSEIEKDGTVSVSVEVENVGKYDGSEVVQVYVRSLDNKFFTEDKALKGFEKVFVKKGKKETVSISLSSNSFEYYNPELEQFVVDGGRYEIVVAKNVNEPVAVLPLVINGENSSVDLSDTLPSYYNVAKEKTLCVSDAEFEKLLKRQLPDYRRKKRQLHTDNSTFLQIKDRFFGKMLYKIVLKETLKKANGDPVNERMYLDSVNYGPLRILAGQGMSRKTVSGMVDLVNGKVFRGMSTVLKEMRKLKKQQRNNRENLKVTEKE